MNNPNEEVTLYVPVMHGEHSLDALLPFEKDPLIDFWKLNDLMTDNEAEAIMEKVTQHLPELAKDRIEGCGYWGFRVEVYKGKRYELCEALDKEADRAIVVVYESGADDDHYDYIPSYVDEFILACRQLEYLAPAQKLYDSLWQGPPTHIQEKPKSASWDWVHEWAERGEDMSGYLEWSDHSAHYPLCEGGKDPGLYGAFENIGVELHKDHPIEQWTPDYLENLALQAPVLFETIARIACKIAFKRGDFSETVNYYEAACKHHPRIKALFDLSMEKVKQND